MVGKRAAQEVPGMMGEDTVGRGDYSHSHEKSPGASLPSRNPQEGIDLTSCGKLDTLKNFCFS